jgi:hypothetical protein
MVIKLVIGAVAAVSAAAGMLSGMAGGVPVAEVNAAPSARCPAVRTFDRGAPRALAAGGGMWAVSGGKLVSVSTSRSMTPAGGGVGIVRHVAADPRAGTAYVIDRAGDDELVVVTSEGTRRFSEPAEVTHPTWSAHGDLAWATGDGVAMLDGDTGRIDRLPAPTEGATVFSPVFMSGDRVAAVVSAPPTARVPEGERLSNLWSVRVDGGRWRRMTSFHARGDRWVALRTPLKQRASVAFVKVIGDATADRPPRFELWRLEGGAARRVARLSQERYLAGTRGSRLVWNVPDPATGRQDLAIERAGGDLLTIGCGAVMVDPADVVDPDRAAHGGTRVPPRGSWSSLEARGHEGDAEEIAVIVGDFATTEQASSVAQTILAAYPTSEVEVVDAAMSPLAIRPGVYGALLHLPLQADPTSALAKFRSVLPQFAANSWIVTP